MNIWMCEIEFARSLRPRFYGNALLHSYAYDDRIAIVVIFLQLLVFLITTYQIEFTMAYFLLDT